MPARLAGLFLARSVVCFVEFGSGAEFGGLDGASLGVGGMRFSRPRSILGGRFRYPAFVAARRVGHTPDFEVLSLCRCGLEPREFMNYPGTVIPRTADEDLADKIAEALDTAGLISAEKLPRVKDGLRKGSLTSADWKLLVELSEPKQTAGGAS